MAEAAMQGANCTSGASWGSVSYSRTFQHAAQPSLGKLGFEPATFWSIANLLYSLNYSHPYLQSKGQKSKHTHTHTCVLQGWEGATLLDLQVSPQTEGLGCQLASLTWSSRAFPWCLWPAHTPQSVPAWPCCKQKKKSAVSVSHNRTP